MGGQSCWKILGIDRTKDKLAIRKAYVKLAHTISPEDDPEGFRKIHAAYKQALDYASGRAPHIPFDLDLKSSVIQPDPVLYPKGMGGTEEKTGKEQKSPYDYSSVVIDAKEYPEEVEYVLEKIVDFKRDYAIDTPVNAARWQTQTMLHRAYTLFDLYSTLYQMTSDIGVWDNFFNEPLILQAIHYIEFRDHVRSGFEEGSVASMTIDDHCVRFENERKRIDEIQHQRYVDNQKKSQRRAFWITLVVCAVSFVFGLMLMKEIWDSPKSLMFSIGVLLAQFIVFGSFQSIFVFQGWDKDMPDSAMKLLFNRNVIMITVNVAYWFMSLFMLSEYDMTDRVIMLVCGLIGVVWIVILCIRYRMLRK